MLTSYAFMKKGEIIVFLLWPYIRIINKLYLRVILLMTLPFTFPYASMATESEPEQKCESLKTRTWIQTQTFSPGLPLWRKYLLLLIALLGCDTTSNLFGVGNGFGIAKSKVTATMCWQLLQPELLQGRIHGIKWESFSSHIWGGAM